ncbi:MAG TPA: transglycosylase SLT domain-containing protein [Steroidobacteraceae bacterium]|jgi:membrane-bound lytic murein transglycosylase D|nr:transglycosylase SLT domain-containing protein [Steroidobacteraceae bacterium]
MKQLFRSFALVCLAAISATAGAAPTTPDTALPRPAALEPAVQFWIRVYTEITTDAGFIHDQQNLSIVYETLHFDAKTSSREREHQVDAEKQRFHDMLVRLGQAVPPASDEEKRVLALWGAAGTPTRLAVAADDVRFQLGQSDRFRAGLIRAGVWQQDIAHVLAQQGLPPELAALPHVESSFDPAAYSKVGAAGLWQFMRSTGRRFLHINSAVDERLDPFRETEAAAQLLAYNYQLLGSWPLAITAYNHGAAGMLRAREELGTDDIVRIIHDYHSPSFGFASRNFYVSFLAALTVSQDPQRYFGDLPHRSEQQFDELRMPAAASAATIAAAVGVERDILQQLNPALRPAVWRGRRAVPAGYVLRLPATAGEMTASLLAQRLQHGHAVLVAAADTNHSSAAAAGLAAVAPTSAGSSSAASATDSSGGAGRHRAQQLALAGTPASAATTNVMASAATSVASPLLEGQIGALPAMPDRMPAKLSSDAGAAATLTAPQTAQYYSVQPGDTVTAIAMQAGMSAMQLMALNSLPDQDFLYEGERLRLTASVPEPGMASSQAAVELTQQAVQESREDRQEVALATHLAAAEEPVSAAQAQAEGPQLGPGSVAGPQSADPVDYSVASDGSIHVVAAETLGHYADWLGVPATRLRQLNHLRGRRPVVIGHRIQLDFGQVTPAQFEQRRRDYHEQLEATYFAMHRIVGTTVYVAHRGDSLWTINQRNVRVPVWLLQQYNPELNFTDLRPGTHVALPRVEETP